MKFLIPLLILIYSHKIKGVLEWTVIGKVTDYGQNVTLFCKVPHCCPKDAGWDRWTPVQRTLFIDIKTGRANKKYDGKVLKNGYTLVIQNLTKNDLNVSYSCLYGVTLGERKFLLEEDVFTSITTIQPDISEAEIAGIIVGVIVLVAVAVLLSFILFWKSRYNNNEHDQETVEQKPLIEKPPKPIGPLKISNITVSSAEIKWQEPEMNIWEPVEKYLIQYRLADTIEWIEAGNVDSPTVRFTIKELKEGQHYSFKVTAINSNGAGSPLISKDMIKLHDIPKYISEEDRSVYMEAINSGTEVRQYVRIQVIGKDRVGKTSLVHRLLGYGKYSGLETNGIEINRKCQIDTNNGKWKVSEVDTEKKKMIITRMRQALNMNQDVKEPIFNQSLPSEENASSEEEKKRNTQKQNMSKDHLKNTEHKRHISRQLNKLDRKQISQEQTPSEGLNIPAPQINSPANTVGLVNESTINPKKIDTSSHVNESCLNKEKTDKIMKTMADEMGGIIADAKDKKAFEHMVECDIWDFAGQKDYYATHQTFFTPEAIYLLVADITEDIKSRKDDEYFDSIGEYIDFWFDSVHCLCKDDLDVEKELWPPVIIVCTCTDKLTEKVEDRIKDYNAQLLNMSGNERKYKHRRGIVFVSNEENENKGINELKVLITEIAKKREYFAETLPTRWIQLEIVLATLKSLDINYFSLKDIAILAQKNLIQEPELLSFLNYQHTIGNIIFFKEIKECIILQPEWLVKCFRCLVCDSHEKGNHSLVNQNDLNTLQKTGELSDALIDELFQKEPELNFVDQKLHLLSVMEKFDIIVKPTFRGTNNDKYYLPCMINLKSCSYEDIKDTFIKNDSKVEITPWLILQFNFLPFAFFNHILFHYLRNYTVCNEEAIPPAKIGDPAIYVGIAVFYLDNDKYSKLVVCFSHNAISLQIWNWKKVDNDKYKTVLNDLCDNIDIIKRKFDQNISYSIQAKCSTGDYSKRHGRIDVLPKGDEYMCEDDMHKELHNKKDIENTWLKHGIQREEKKQHEQAEKKRQKEEESQKEKKKKKDLPEIIHQLSEGDKIRYKKLLQSSKTEKRYFVRTMIVGKGSAGKTCLMRRLLKEDISDATSTDGVDIVVRRCKINIENGKWIIGKEIDDDKVSRIKRALIQDAEDSRDTQIMQEDEAKNIIIRQGEEMSTYNKDTATDAMVSLDKSGETNESSLLVMPEDFTTDANVSLDNFKETTASSSLVMPEDLVSNVFSKSTDNNLSNLYALCELWDFAGQKEFYATHQAFLTSCAVYLVVADMKDDISKQGLSHCFTEFQDAGEYVDFWFDSIHCHRTVVEQSGYRYFDPPIILVFTGKDKYDKAGFEKRKKELNDQMDRVFGLQSKYHHLRHKFYLSNTVDSNEEFEKLRYAISETARKMDNWGNAFPLKWILLEHLIEINKKNGKNVINFIDMSKLAKHPDINILKKDELLLFLRFQHNVGNIIFFGNILDLIILRPQWLADAFRCLVSDRVVNRRLHHLEDWALFKQHGKISESLIRELFESKDGSQLSGQKNNLYKVMEKLDIIVKIENSSYYIMPSAIPSSTFDVVCEKFGILTQNCKRTSWLCFKFEFLPPSFFNHLSAWFIRNYYPSKVDGGIALYRGICMFDIDRSGGTKILITMSTDTIALQVVSVSEQEISESTCSNIYSEVKQLIEDIKKSYEVKLSFTLHFKCSDGYYWQDTIEYIYLKTEKECFCTQHKQMHRSEQILSPWMNNEVTRIPARVKMSTNQDDHDPLFVEPVNTKLIKESIPNKE